MFLVVLIFNFSYSSDELNKSVLSTNKYYAFDSTMNKVLAQSYSFNSLSKLVGIINVS